MGAAEQPPGQLPSLGFPPHGASPRQALRAPGPVAVAPALPHTPVPAAHRQRGQGQPAATSPGCQHSAATAILRHGSASRAPIFKCSRAQLWLDNAGFALISQSGGARWGGTSVPRQGFGPWAVPLLCHGHLLPLASSWAQGTGSSWAPSSSTRTSQPWGDTGTVRGHAGTGGDRGLWRDPRQPRATQGCHEGGGAPGDSQGFPQDP